MQEATTFFVVTILSMAAALGFFFYRAKKDPQNKNLEPGAVLIKFFITYPLTVFITLQLIAMISEAALLASIQDKDINVTARMTVHMFLAVVGGLGAFVMTKYLGSVISVFFIKEPMPKKIGLFLGSSMLALISLFFTIGSPIFNLHAMAHSLKQTAELEIFLTSLWVMLGIDHPNHLTFLLSKHHLPLDYSPFQNLHSGVVTSLALSTTHLLITLWEVLVTLTLAIKNDGIQHAILGEFFNVPPVKEEGREEGRKERGEERGKH
jgi:hypothetical protein